MLNTKNFYFIPLLHFFEKVKNQSKSSRHCVKLEEITSISFLVCKAYNYDGDGLIFWLLLLGVNNHEGQGSYCFSLTTLCTAYLLNIFTCKTRSMVSFAY